MTEQVWQAHDHNGLRHEHFVIAEESHTHTPDAAPAAPVRSQRASAKVLAGQDAYREAIRRGRAHRPRKLPLWVSALEAHVESMFPVGRHGYTEARYVVEQVKEHYRQETKLVEAT